MVDATAKDSQVVRLVVEESLFRREGQTRSEDCEVARQRRGVTDVDDHRWDENWHEGYF